MVHVILGSLLLIKLWFLFLTSVVLIRYLMVTLITLGLYLANGVQGAGSVEIEASLSMGEAISYVMSIWILAAVAAPDIARYAKSRKDAILGAGLGFLLGNSAIILVSLFLTHMTGTDDLVEVFFSIGLGFAAIIVLVFAQWTTNSSNLCSRALGISVALPKISRPALVVLMTAVGLLIAQFGMVDQFTNFLSLLSVTIAPSAGVYLAQYYFIDAKSFSFSAIKQAPNWKVFGLVAWALGTVVSACTSPDLFALFDLTSISAVDGILISLISFMALTKLSTLFFAEKSKINRGEQA